VEAPNKEAMLSLAEKAVDKALRSGASEAEAYVYVGEGTNIGIERGQVTKSSKVIDNGIGVRVILDKRIGFAYTNIMEEASAAEVVSKALCAAKANKPDPEWHELPGTGAYSQVEKTYDPRIPELKPEALMKDALLMLEAAINVDKRVLPVEGGIGAAYAATAVYNSNGVSCFDKGTVAECSVATIAKDGNNVTPVCFEFSGERLYAVNPAWVGKEAAKVALSALQNKKVETKNGKLIISQFALQELLYYTFFNALKADSVQREQSPLKGKKGEIVASEKVTFLDHGLLEGGLRSAVFDAEGVPHQKTTIIEKGILRDFLYDNYTARKENRESTGNASRSGYMSTPAIEVTNFCVQPGNCTPDQMISEVDDGLLVYYLQGAHSSNPVNGDFSVVATPAWQIRHGEIVHSTRGVMLSGNVFELLKNIIGIANNCRQVGQLVAPWVEVENVRVIGHV
jgi:PmbA protein